jgi:hypothetical protein
MEDLARILIYCIVPILLASLLLCAFNRFLPPWFCRVMGWHLAPKDQEHNGANMAGNCPRCGKRVLQDSQGGWS